MTTYTPSEIAKGDQHYAMVAANLDDIIETYTAHRGALDRVPALDSMTRFFAGLLPTPDGVDPEGRIITLANLLALATDRLAAK